ncbi:hypothetical protein CPB83DRAFT_851093 [Crepidotus variabilis]|uniref:Tyrosinase copper-binding domain-containing protein n=1 Tax=Crepidotus variabilis TaxID=179855 RepID=A0A9P6JS43_9AGAR|nr:hypothetical protein CPB83DRAFT_851093 [Crepidotus variabilis]
MTHSNLHPNSSSSKFRAGFYIPFVTSLCLLVFLGLAWPTDDSSIPNGSSFSEFGCKRTLVRKEWRTLSNTQKAAFIGAVRCTQTLPNMTTYEGVRTRYDDFQAVHIHTADTVHYVGHFLPWHRGFVKMYEDVLREECGYDDAIPYWDWEVDIDSGQPVQKSPIFDPKTGFGGDGVPGTYTLPSNISSISLSDLMPSTFKGCVLDGPFSSAHYTVHLGPGKLITSHCLVRGIDNSVAHYLSSEVVNHALRAADYARFREALEGKPGEESEHESGHMIIGGDFGNFYSSPADPIFFLHHANLDRIWWTWQTIDLKTRLFDVSMSNHQTHRRQERPGKSQEALEYMLDYGQLSQLPLFRTIREVMDVRGAPLCYAYV